LAHARAEPVARDAGGRWSDFSIRLASALILGPIALFCVWRGGVPWALLIGLAMAGLGMEWARLARLPAGNLFLLLPVLAWIAALLLGPAAGLFALLAAAAVAAWRYGKFAAAGIPYIGLGGLALLWLRMSPARGLQDTAFLIAVIWGTDIGAYLVGRIAGGPKLAPKISPGKTWSGAAGGLACAALAGLLIGHLRASALPVALLLSILAQSGDLLESAIKRRLGVKDSGQTIPGHGGLFDRLDGFLAAAPAAALLALSTQGGLPLWP
jgi:phosphatidate cytidylyltransferase